VRRGTLTAVNKAVEKEAAALKKSADAETASIRRKSGAEEPRGWTWP